MLKVGVISTAHIPSRNASGIQVMKMCQAFTESGGAVALIARKQGTPPPSPDELRDFYGLRRPFQMLFLDGGRLFPLWAAVRGAMLGVDWVYTRCIYTAMAAIFLKRPVVLELHDLVRLRRHVRPYRHLSRSKKLIKFLAITDSLRADLMQTYPDTFTEVNTVIEPDGVDLPAFEAVGEAALDAFRRRFPAAADFSLIAGFAGNLYPGKGLEIIKALAPRMPQVLFLVAGGQPEDLAKESAAIQSLQLKNIALLGFLKPREVPVFCQSCDLLLLPNQPRVEAFGGGDIGRYTSPLKLFEYMASDKPIVASGLPVIREILSEDTACLVRHDDLAAWQSVIEHLAGHPQRRQQLATAARKRVADFDWQARAARILSLAESCTGKTAFSKIRLN